MALAFDPRPRAAAVDTAGLIFAVPHRFFFLTGVGALALTSLWWAWTLAARAWPEVPPPPGAVPDATLHALLMTFGFAPFFMFGFLFTAGPRWLAVPPPGPGAWLPPGVLAAFAALALVPLQVAGSWLGGEAVRFAAGAYAVGWLWLAFRFFLLLRASEAPDKAHATLVLLALVIGASGVAAFALWGAGAHSWLRSAGLWGFLLPVFVTVCHRMIPFFTASVVPFVTAFRPWWLLSAMAGAPVLHGVLELAGLPVWTWLVDLPVGVLMLWLTMRWGLVQSMKNRLLAMLHVGFLWYAIGFVLAGAQSLLLLRGTAVPGHVPLHALTIGFASSLLMAMVTRVTCGHSGRTLAADTVTWRLFQLLQVVAVLRVGVELLPSPGGLAAVALLWVACFVPWCAKYAPVYWRPRADGRPG
jgi:uncharacterized protein involved in response to NO